VSASFQNSVIGGVISSTLMTLLMLPVLYHYLGPRGTEHMPLAVPPAS
jgi:Cu/Ag efflux pump CusA